MTSDSILAMHQGDDPRRIGARLWRAHEQFVSSHRVPRYVRPVVAGSWERCAAAGTSYDGSHLAPVSLESDELDDYRSRHPFAALLPMFRELLGETAEDGGHIFAVTDASGTLLWVEGKAALLGKAERMNFVEGAAWSEDQAGTNAPGTALAVGRPVQIFATEHYNSVVQPWSCSAAPIRDPYSGMILGVIDVTGYANVASPQAMALVRATARAAEGELARHVMATTDPVHHERRFDDSLWPRSERPAARLSALGRVSALLEVDGRVGRLSPRHSEIVTVLALTSGGRTGEALAVGLSEQELSPSTIRAEMTRLRAVLGTDLLGSRPYTLRRPVASDFVDVRDLLADGKVSDAVAAYAGPLLPSSEAPAIVENRMALEQQLRGAILASGDPFLLRRWVNAAWGADDAVAWHTLARRLPEGSTQRAAAAARAQALHREFAAPQPRRSKM
jgi:hypothetical protein